MKDLKIMSVFGIRPDWIKGGCVLKEIDRRGLDHIIVHTGQHYSSNLDKIFFEQLSLRAPDYHLGVGSGTQGEQLGKIVIETEKVLMKEKPDLVLTLGDCNSALATLAAAKLNIPVAHIESGMRAFDWRMPEEKNKRIIDAVCRYNFCYTHYQRENLLLENMGLYRIFVTGNPTVDTLRDFGKLASENRILEKLKISPGEYFLVTLHRAENVDSLESLSKLMKALKAVYEKYKKPLVWPVMPRTHQRLSEFSLAIPKGVVVIEPQGFLEFLKLEMDAKGIISDSGTVQEEGCILKVPVVVARYSTERPETVDIGSSIVAGVEPEDILSAVDESLGKKADWTHPYGKDVSKKMVDIIEGHKKEDTLSILKNEYIDLRKRKNFSKFLMGGN